MKQKLEKKLKELEKVVISYSGGIDSSFLVKFAKEILGKEKVLAIIANGEMIPRKDYKEAIKFLAENEISYIEIPFVALDIKEFKENKKNRCYYCKKKLMTQIIEVAKENGISNVLDGSNLDDKREYRPGMEAKKELGIISPLEELGFTKKDIRRNAKDIGIKFWDKPSNSCLATRFPYNVELTQEGLKKVEKAEEIIKSLGITNTRVRVHGRLARIEVKDKDFATIIQNKEEIEKIKKIGFNYVTLDIMGIKSGSFD